MVEESLGGFETFPNYEPEIVGGPTFVDLVFPSL